MLPVRTFDSEIVSAVVSTSLSSSTLNALLLVMLTDFPSSAAALNLKLVVSPSVTIRFSPSAALELKLVSVKVLAGTAAVYLISLFSSV